MKHRISIAIGLMVLAIAGTSYAASGSSQADKMSEVSASQDAIQDQSPRPHRVHRRMWARLARELDLTDAQKEQIKSIRESERATIEPLIRQLAEVRQELRSVTAKGQFDEEQVRNLATQQAQAMAELTVVRARVKSQIYNVLTPEQQAQLDQISERVKDRILHRVGRPSQR